MSETRAKVYVPPLRVHSRVRVRAIVVWAMDSQSEQRSRLKCLDTTGTVVAWDPRWTLPCYVQLDNGESHRFAPHHLEVLEI